MYDAIATTALACTICGSQDVTEATYEGQCNACHAICCAGCNSWFKDVDLLCRHWTEQHTEEDAVEVDEEMTCPSCGVATVLDTFTTVVHCSGHPCGHVLQFCATLEDVPYGGPYRLYRLGQAVFFHRNAVLEKGEIVGLHPDTIGKELLVQHGRIASSANVCEVYSSPEEARYRGLLARLGTHPHANTLLISYLPQLAGPAAERRGENPSRSRWRQCASAEAQDGADVSGARLLLLAVLLLGSSGRRAADARENQRPPRPFLQLATG